MSIKTYISRTLIATLLLCSLSACFPGDDLVPEDAMNALQGTWQQDNGTATIRFYPDETIKLTMPDEQPPIRLLSVMEVIKDEKIGFGVGDRWNGPVHVVLAKDRASLELIFPGDSENRTIRFHRQQS